MRFAAFGGFIFGVMGCFAQQQALEITATLKTKSPQLGKPIVVTFCMKNVSALTVTLVMGNPARNYEFTVLDESGKEVPLTTYGKNAKARIGFRYFPTLVPGAEIREDVRFDEIIEFTQPGRYALKVKRESSPDGPVDHSRWTPSESNTLSFTVLENWTDKSIARRISPKPINLDSYGEFLQFRTYSGIIGKNDSRVVFAL